MSPRSTLLLALAPLLGACATAGGTARPELPPPAREIRAGARDPGAGSVPPPAPPARDAALRAAVETAKGLVGQREIVVGGSRYGDDCTALVRASFAQAGVPLPAAATSATSLHRLARERNLLRRGAPQVGDVVFLADAPGGAPAHVGIVESVSADGTALVLHRTGRGVARLRVNAAQPWKLKADGGRRLNDPLVTGAGRVSAGRLFVGYASMV
jgi:hypothetical protein